MAFAAPKRERRGTLWGCFWGLASIGALLAMALNAMVSLDRGSDSFSLWAALWDDTNWRLSALVAVIGLLLLVVVVALIVGTPRARARREVRVGRDGLELIAHPRAWYRGDRALLRWDEVQVVSAEHGIFPERVGRSTHRVPREVLDFYVFRDIEGLPDFAASSRVDTTRIEGVRAPAFLLRIGGPGKRLAASVRDLAPAVDAVHPELFYRGTAVDQWYAASPAGTEPPRAAPAAPAGERAAADAGPSAAPLSTPLWLDYRAPTARTLGVLAGLVALGAVCYVPIYFIGSSDGGILMGVLGLAVAVPFLVGVIGFVFGLLGLPRALALRGVLIDAEGLEFVEKPRWALGGQARSRIPWSDVQIILARDSAAVDQHGLQQSSHVSVTDIYLRGDTSFQRPGVGLPLTITHLESPQSTRMRELAAFPAVRVRLPHSPAAAAHSAGTWRDLPADTPGPHRLPGSQLQAALRAARPGLCHGFEDPAPVQD